MTWDSHMLASSASAPQALVAANVKNRSRTDLKFRRGRATPHPPNHNRATALAYPEV